jgi:hypothetical protein
MYPVADNNRTGIADLLLEDRAPKDRASLRHTGILRGKPGCAY